MKDRDRLEALAAVLEYPGPDFPDLASVPRAFADRVSGLAPGEMEELYTRTFEVAAPCALEVGWHVYGEQYERGALLVRLRGLMREHGVAEGTELPDHLASVLRLLGRLPEGEARDLVDRIVAPATEAMLAALDADGNPYSPVLAEVREVIGAHCHVG